MKSEVFSNFIKIAEEKGMIPLDAPDKAKKILEANPRWDSLDISAIEALYGVKPNLPKDNQYEHNIMEDAHPNSVIMSPAHDKLNGLVENNNEQQNILLHIVQKTPDGLSTQRKYARQDLLLALVRIGNDLDNRNQDELRKLADTCLEQTSTMKKVAFWPIVAAVAGLIGALYLQQHLPFINESLEKNHQKLVTEVDDLLNASASWGVGRQYKQGFLNMLREFKNRLNHFYDQYRQKAEPIFKELERPKTSKELMERAKQPETATILEAYNDLLKEASEMETYMDQVAKDFKSESYKVRQVEETGFLTGLVEKTHVLVGGKGMIADDFDDVVRAIDPYKKSIDEILARLNEAKSLENAAKEDFAKISQKEEMKSEPKPEPKPEAVPAQKEEDIEDLEKEFEGMPELG
jgi:hypothetical protein